MSSLMPIVFRLQASIGRRGSAFLLQPGYALTAAHCIFNGIEQASEIRLELPGRSFTAQPIWRDDITPARLGLDAAILRISDYSSTHSQAEGPATLIGKLPRRELPHELSWHSFGYPIFDAEQLGTDLTGNVAGIQVGTGFKRLQLTCDQFGSDTIALEGASGSPITVNGRSIAMISRTPTQFKQRIVYASLLEDVFAEFFRVAGGDTTNGLKDHADRLKSSFEVFQTLELDECDRSLNRYLASLRKRGTSFHGIAVKTPQCTTGRLEELPLEETYVQATLFKISDVRDFWTDEKACRISGKATAPVGNRSLTEVVSQTIQTNGRLQLLITGYAGAGKSTLLNYIALKALFAPSEIGLTKPMLPVVLSISELAKVKCVESFAEWLRAARSKNLEVSAPNVNPKFFEQFCNRLGAEWLLLFDGFDEVPELTRKGLQRSLRECVRASSLNWCLTSRPAVNLSDPIIDISQGWKGVQSFKILPWTDAELRRFVSTLLGNDEDTNDFLQQFRFIALDRSTTTPLLTLIAICVYCQNSRKLPRSKARLFGLFVDNAILRGLERNVDVASDWIDPNDRQPLIDLLSQLALFSADDSSFDRQDDLQDWVRTRLQEMQLGKNSARKSAADFVQVVAAGSGLLVFDDQSHWRWWHSTMRDYLAAVALVNSSTEVRLKAIDKCFAHESVGSESESNATWKEIVLYMIAILSDKHQINPSSNADVTKLFRYISGRYVGSGLLLYIALAEGAKVEEDMETFVIESLVHGARQMGSVAECKEYNEELERQGRSPVELLSKLGDLPAAVAGLTEIKNDKSVEVWMREKADEALRRLVVRPIDSH